MPGQTARRLRCRCGLPCSTLEPACAVWFSVVSVVPSREELDVMLCSQPICLRLSQSSDNDRHEGAQDAGPRGCFIVFPSLGLRAKQRRQDRSNYLGVASSRIRESASAASAGATAISEK